jgi:delta24-sterol reductase
MGRLSRELIRKGWTLQVLPELDELTVGGLVNGFGIETSSHKYGLFQHICTAFEIVLPSGEFVTCDAQTNSDLFATIPWSHGTLGFLVGAAIKVIRAAPYVRIEYIPCHSRAEGIRVFEEASRNNSIDFVESLVFSRNQSVVMLGKLSQQATDGPINSIGRWYKPWFFTHVQEFLNRGPQCEYIPLRDYYHRHTRSIFWEIRDIVPFGNSAWYRWLFAWAGPPKVAVLKLTTTGKLKVLWETMHVAQDLLVPMTTLDQALDVFHNELTVYPLWLCPMRMLSPAENLLSVNQQEPGHPSLRSMSSKYPLQPLTTPVGSLTPPHPSEQLYVDIGAYGVPKAPQFHCIRTLERIESYVRSVQGYQALYADSCMSAQEFRLMFDHRLYDQVRTNYGIQTAFPQIWEKVNRNARA